VPINRRYISGVLPSLDGWRAISVGLVLFAHSHPPQQLQDIAFFCGSIGVRFFFVISGFLITWLLLREGSTSKQIDLKAFYQRRVFRIFPVYYVFLLFYAYLEQTADRQISYWQQISNFLFLANYSEVVGPTAHLWTLGVEGQFYLIWPLVFARAKLHENLPRMMKILVPLVIVCPIIRGVCYLFPYESLPVILSKYSFLRHADEIGVGCLTAGYLWFRPRVWNYIEKHYLSIAVAGGALCALPWFTGPINGFNLVNVPLGPSFIAVGFTLLMLSSIVRPLSPPFVILNIRPLVFIGALSYSIYIWHPLLAPSHSGWATVFTGWLNTNPWWILATLLWAICSYRLLERPFMDLRKRLHRQT
jgi:peptidoglycan/LPS O-acetylase OafA/YrhL